MFQNPLNRIPLNKETHQQVVRFIEASKEDPQMQGDAKILQASLDVSPNGRVTIKDDYAVINALSRVVDGESLWWLIETNGKRTRPPKTQNKSAGSTSKKDLRSKRHAYSKLTSQSALLQNIAKTAGATPISLVKELASKQLKIEKEIAKANGFDFSIAGFALSTLALALIESGKFRPKRKWLRAVRLASARELYERSSILRTIDKDALLSPQKLMSKLKTLRPHILKLKKNSNKTDGTPFYSFLTLTRALIAGGMIPENKADAFERTASYRDFYERSAVLRNVVPKLTKKPELLATSLHIIRKQLEDEQSANRTERAEYGFSTIIDTLVACGAIQEDDEETFSRWANALDLYEHSPLLRSISLQNLSDIPTIAAQLKSIRRQVIEEQKRLKPDYSPDQLSISTMLLSCMAGKIALSKPNDVQALASKLHRMMRFITSAELYDNSPILQSIDALSFEELYKKLKKLAPEISAEQRQARPKSAKRIPPAYSVSTLVAALQVGKKMTSTVNKTPDKDQTRNASARTIFERSPTLQQIGRMRLQDDFELARKLLARRDRIAVENMQAKGEIPSHSYHFPGAESYYALATLAGALRAGGLLEDQRATLLTQAFFGPIEYFLKRRNVIEPYIRELKTQGHSLHTLKGVDLSLFTSISDPTKLVCGRYVRRILVLGAWLMTDTSIHLRSILHATEIVDMAFAEIENRLIPQEIAARLLRAKEKSAKEPACARRDAIITLKDMLITTEKSVQYSVRMKNVVEWNSDALQLPTLETDEQNYMSKTFPYLAPAFPLPLISGLTSSVCR